MTRPKTIGAKFLAVAAASLSLGVLGLPACGGGDAQTGEEVEDSGRPISPVDSGSLVDTSYTPPVYDTGTTPEPVIDSSVAETSSPPPSGCAAHCTQNSDCAAVCTAPSGDEACCDTATSMCYVATGSCQETAPSDGGPTAPY
jgi:hypothetical protein